MICSRLDIYFEDIKKPLCSMAVILETSLGDLTIDLLTEDRPRACLSFLKLCKMKYFNMCLFHTVQRNLVAQSGDPDGTGRGGVSIYKYLYGEQAAYFEAETKPRIKHTRKGLVSMVNDGNNIHGSQFCITLADDLDYLDQQGHTVFGEVSEGEEVLDKLNELYCDKENKPYQNVRILHTIVLDDPYDDPEGLDFPPESPKPNMKDLENGRLEYDEDIDPFEGKTEEEVQAIQAEKEAKANAQILEMIGDLPDQDVAPEENVLFVCKLNPVTTDDDLEIIFSRFGKINSCEVIRDSKSKESLQYAFIEFDKKDSCEMAYFKMDNVLIDDRRIHVDFSQSVAKVKWKGKGKGVETFGEKTEKSGNSQSHNLYGLNFDQMSKKTSSKAKYNRTTGRVTSQSPNRERKKLSRSTETRKDRSRSTSRSRRQDRSRSQEKQRKKHSRSRDFKRRSRSLSREKKNRIRSRSKEKKHDNWSKSRDKKYRSRSRSRDRKYRSRSRSRNRRYKNRSRSRDRNFKNR
ncbi:peptidyl-prolyl cis-trans isomerase sig-7-like [Watersipora subatra]|uniref:peptidyl-prolyl cis-trans isomerase sig-7-like n=1 Tax=Watersipora subatra TaxID=2589382 RepID=UPI00355B28F9